MTSPADPFDDPELRAEMERLGADAGMPRTDEPVEVPTDTHEGGRARHPLPSSSDEVTAAPQLPALSRADRTVIRLFGDWLDVQPETDIPSTGEGVRMLRAGFARIRQAGHDPLVADDVWAFLDELGDSYVSEALLITLAEYALFQLDTTDSDEWDDLHDAITALQVANAGRGGIVSAAMDAGAEVDPAVRYDALVQLPLVSAVSDLLEWIGHSKPVAPSGGVRLADIAHMGELLGVSVTGSVPRRAADTSSEPLFPIEEPTTDPPQVTSMLEVPALVAWWSALGNVGLIEVTGSHVVPGRAAATWMLTVTPPVETADMVVGLFLARLLTYHVESHRSVTSVDAVNTALDLILAGIDVTGGFTVDAPLASQTDALGILQPAREVGLFDLVNGRVVVSNALRLTVARGVTVAAMLVSGAAADKDE
ncbi:hypothetical protein ET475_05805 [Microbacterium protaetiae]|uniref:Uncharacterized protein n=1 Tax=Microbacterium protaetiae TaxID=2509458 RepID=A0A4P6ED04_9MICO|nr:hypothetical protein [Microbacterium protaetiae]QAY59546.1 hypothetical protein ET475_05805 [Microbacterium protaetiae]